MKVKPCRQLPHPEAAALTLPAVLAALSDPIRLEIAERLAATPGEHGWSEFDLPICKSTLSHHVKVLREAGVIRHRKDGTRCWIAANPCLEAVFPGLLAGILAHRSRASGSAASGTPTPTLPRKREREQKGSPLPLAGEGWVGVSPLIEG